jgi:hypothetical protein
MRLCAAIMKPEAERELAELERGMPHIYGMRGLGFYLQNGVLSLLRDVETDELIFRVSGVHRDTGKRPHPYWLLDRETQTLHDLPTSEVYEIDQAMTVH